VVIQKSWWIGTKIDKEVLLGYQELLDEIQKPFIKSAYDGYDKNW